jgi:hypothetical protein
MLALEVGPEDGGVETIFRVVGDLDRLIRRAPIYP